jgi:ABC-2 type transport system ATP-binding protein
MNALETTSLSKRYRSVWALQDCTLELPAGRIVALVGPNGAGKTTLLLAAAGLLTPTEGSARVLGGLPAGSMQALDEVGFVAQNAPLYPNLSIRTIIRVAKGLNRDFDAAAAAERLEQLGLDTKRKVGKLSGGQQAQLALTLALARHPALLILDEPLAPLDPVARHDFMGYLMSAVAETGASVVFSSHVVSELERVADYLVLLATGRVTLAGSIEELLSEHAVLNVPAEDSGSLQRYGTIVRSESAARHVQALVRCEAAGARPLPAGWESAEPSLEEIVLGYLRDAAPVPFGGLNRPELNSVPTEAKP